MGMYDSLLDAEGHEWQTKAFDCQCEVYRAGDLMPEADASTYQVEVFGGGISREPVESLATVRDDVLVSVHDPRDTSLPLLDYYGGIVADAKEA